MISGPQSILSMKKYLILLTFLVLFLSANAQQSININMLSVTTQPTRFEVARIYIDVGNWNITGNLEVDLKEKFFSAGLRKTYTVSYGYGVSPRYYLKDMSGMGSNGFQLSLGSEVTVSGNIKYVPVYIDLMYYAYVDVVLRTNWRLTTDAANTSQGYLYYNQSPTGFSISSFTADATVYLSNSATNTILSGNVGVGTSTPSPADGSARTFQIGNNMILQNVVGNQVSLSNNAYYDGANWLTASMGPASGVRLYNGEFNVFTAPVTTPGSSMNSTWVPRLTVSNIGNVGIGTTVPEALLDVGKTLNSGDLGSVLARLPEGNTLGGGTYLGIKGYDTQLTGTVTNVRDVKSFSIEHSFYGVTNNSINFFRGDGYTGGSIAFNTNDNTERMRILYNGNVCIGTSDSKGYKLAVAGNAIAESMTVKLQANWPDYVFKKEHALMPLADLKTYIDKNQHLPEIPSADEVEKNGQDLGEMNKLLVKKMEEMTLYMIEKDKEIKELQKQVAEIKNTKP